MPEKCHTLCLPGLRSTAKELATTFNSKLVEQAPSEDLSQENDEYAKDKYYHDIFPTDVIQILTAQKDDGRNYHSRGAIHTGPTMMIVGPVWITPRE